MFSERLARRSQAWWGTAHAWPKDARHWYRPTRTFRYFSQAHRVHRLKERLLLRSLDDPDERWHCCAFWQRTLGNKWNSREFAQKHGCRVPALYWHGRRIGGLALESLPEHYVIRPTFEAGRQGVYVLAGGLELLRNTRYTKPALMAELKRTHGLFSPTPALVEEFVRTESGEYRLPVEYKIHTFGERIGAIQVFQRPSGAPPVQSFYSASWERFRDLMCTPLRSALLPPGADVEAPRCLDEMLESARRLGVAYGSYVRIDFYSTDRGCVFGEFANRPAGGAGFTPYAERYFDELWRQAFPDGT